MCFLQNQDVTRLGGLGRKPGLHLRPLLLAQVAGVPRLKPGACSEATAKLPKSLSRGGYNNNNVQPPLPFWLWLLPPWLDRALGPHSAMFTDLMHIFICYKRTA